MLAPREKPRPLDKVRAILTTPNGAFVAFWVYVLAFAVLRLAGSPNIGTDDVQQALAAQSWAWGYEPRNPPLYTWLLMGAYSAFGVTQIAHVFVKYALMLTQFVFAYLCGRRLFKTPGYAELAALSLVLLHLVGISAHMALTHTVALSATLFVTWWALLRVLQERRAWDYALLGAACALGLLAKYNFVLEIIALATVGVALRETRPAVLNWRMLIAVGISALLVAPHALWAISAHYDFRQYLDKASGVGASGGFAAAAAAGLSDLVITLLVELLPFWLLAVMVFRPSRRRPMRPLRPAQRLLWWALLAELGLVLVVLLTQGATDIKARYLAPLILQAPMAFFILLEVQPPGDRRLNLYAGAVVLGAVLTFGGLVWQTYFHHEHCKNCWREMPVWRLAEQLRDSGFSQGTIIASEWHVGGNLRLQFPNAAVLSPQSMPVAPPRAGGGCVMAWNTRLEGLAAPVDLVSFASERLGAAPAGSPVYVRAPLLRSHRRLDGLAYWIVSNADGNCRALHAPP